MSRPWKHPKTGVFWLRRRVPENLRALVGKGEELLSLKTKDADEAKRRFLKALAEVEERWESLRRGSNELTEREAHALATRIHDNWVALHEDNPSEQYVWSAQYFDRLWISPAVHSEARPMGDTIGADTLIIDSMRRFCLQQTDHCMRDLGLILDPWARQRLAKAVAAAFQRASLTLSRMATGEFDVNPPGAATKASASPAIPSSADSVPIELSALLRRWWQEAKAAGRKPSTYESYRNTLTGFIAFLGHDQANRVTAKDVVAYKDHRLTTASAKTGRIPSAKTVKDSDLSALKTLFGWAVSNQLLPQNPATGITIKLAKRPRVRSKGFSETEAKAILTASMDLTHGGESAGTYAAKKWVPWLCAFTGARVGEIAQLRKQDLTRAADLWVIRITPEAGTVKNNEAREVVLHTQVVELGFPEFVEGCADGPLFLRAGKNGDVLGPLQGLKNRLAEFARAIVPDPGVAPNHGWRHRFKTIGMEAGIAPRILDAIQGQAARSVADTYGDVTFNTIAAAISRLPNIAVETPTRHS